MCPQYMSIGMTYDEFWYQDVSRVIAYRRAHEIRERRENWGYWLQGAYIYDALCNASPLFRFSMKRGSIKPEPYAKEPYPITEAELREKEERDARAREERLKAEFALFAQQMRAKMPVEAHPVHEGGEINAYDNRQSVD